MKTEVRVWWEELAEWYAERANDLEGLGHYTCDALDDELQFGDSYYWANRLERFFIHWEECAREVSETTPDGRWPCEEWENNYSCEQHKRAQLCLWMNRVILAYLEDETVMPWEVK